jgi:Fe-S cluster assembly protein SufB
MSDDLKILDDLSQSEYKWGFVSDIQSDNAPKGLNEGTIRFISAKKMNRNGCLNGG